MSPELSFPRQHARTQRFRLGVPSSFEISPERIAFLRSRTGSDRNTCLWVRDSGGAERVVADPVALLGGGEETLPPEERAPRERGRQGAAGVVTYATDDAVRVAAFALSGRLFVADLVEGTVRELPAAGPVVDPRPDPTGKHVAYVANGALRVVGPDGDRVLAEPDAPEVTYGLPEFVAAEEMHRTRGYWWSPDGRRLLVARVDTSPVTRWHLSDPAHPERPPTGGRLPGGGHRERRRRRGAGRARRHPPAGAVGRRGAAVPERGALVGAR